MGSVSLAQIEHVNCYSRMCAAIKMEGKHYKINIRIRGVVTQDSNSPHHTILHNCSLNKVHQYMNIIYISTQWQFCNNIVVSVSVYCYVDERFETFPAVGFNIHMNIEKRFPEVVCVCQQEIDR